MMVSQEGQTPLAKDPADRERFSAKIRILIWFEKKKVRQEGVTLTFFSHAFEKFYAHRSTKVMHRKQIKTFRFLHLTNQNVEKAKKKKKIFERRREGGMDIIP